MSDYDDNINERLELWFPTVFVQAVYGGAMIGIQLFMCIYGLVVLSEAPKARRRGRGMYLLFSFIILACDCIYRIATMVGTFTLMTKPSNSEELLQLSDEVNASWYLVLSSWAYIMILWLGDGLLVYRCFLVWTGRRVVVIVPAVLYMAFLATSLWSNIESMGLERATASLEKAWLSLSAAVNCTTTILIAGRLLQLRKRSVKIIEGFDSRLYLSIIAIVAESALLSALAGIFLAVCYGAPESAQPWRGWKIAENVSPAVWDVFSVLSPQLIIFRVITGRSFAHASQRSTVLSTIRFVDTANNNGSRSGFDTEKEEGDNDVIAVELGRPNDVDVHITSNQW